PMPFRLRLLGPILGRCVPSRCNALIVFSITWKFNVNTIHANPVGRCPSSGGGGQNRFPVRVNREPGWLRRRYAVMLPPLSTVAPAPVQTSLASLLSPMIRLQCGIRERSMADGSLSEELDASTFEVLGPWHLPSPTTGEW